MKRIYHCYLYSLLLTLFCCMFSSCIRDPVEPVPPESANAGFKDWFLQVFKRPAFTIEAGLGENPLPTSQLPEITRALSAIFTAAMQW